MCPKFGRNEHLISVKDKTHPSYYQSTGDLSSEVKQLGREIISKAILNGRRPKGNNLAT